MKDLGRRLFVSGISIAVLIFLLLFAYQSWIQYGLILAVAALAAIAMWEYEQFAKAKGGRMIFPALLAVTVLETVAFYISAHNPLLQVLPLAVFFAGVLILFALHLQEKDGAIVDLAVSTFGLFYIAVPMGMILGILYFPFVQDPQEGRWWLVYLLAVTKITDIGAYFAGSLWGRRKLAPRISPGKTVEGAAFGLVCALLASFIFHLLKDYYGFRLGIYEWFFLGLALGVIGQFGDLSESLLKRDANKKDSNDLPGLGGVLDSVDSLLLNAPIVYLYLTYIRV